MGKKIGTTILESCLAISTKAEYMHTLWPSNSNSTPRFILKRKQPYVHQKIHMRMKSATLNITVKNWRLFQCPLTVKDKLWYSYTMKCQWEWINYEYTQKYSSVSQYNGDWRNQTQKNTYCIFHLYSVKKQTKLTSGIWS